EALLPLGGPRIPVRYLRRARGQGASRVDHPERKLFRVALVAEHVPASQISASIFGDGLRRRTKRKMHSAMREIKKERLFLRPRLVHELQAPLGEEISRVPVLAEDGR